MQKDWLSRKGEQDLVLYMLGWASTPNAVCHIHPTGCDVLAVHHYMSLEPFCAEDFSAYRRIYLFAWSFGVWAAEQCCQELPLYKAIALNGTPFPADARYGMRLRAALRRISSLARMGVNPFETQRVPCPPAPFPERDAQDKVEELTRLAAWSENNSTARLHWDKAWIADKDEMFSPANMWAWWGSVGLGTGFSAGHYPFADPSIVLGEIEP